MSKGLMIFSGGIALYAIGMWLAWFDEQSTFGSAPSEWSNHEQATIALVLAGACAILLGAIFVGFKLTIGRRTLCGCGAILLAMAMGWLWDHSPNVLQPNVHGWSAGFLLLPLLMLASGGAWLLMALGGAARHYWKQRESA